MSEHKCTRYSIKRESQQALRKTWMENNKLIICDKSDKCNKIKMKINRHNIRNDFMKGFKYKKRQRTVSRFEKFFLKEKSYQRWFGVLCYIRVNKSQLNQIILEK